jgi:hypothetical protein
MFLDLWVGQLAPMAFQIGEGAFLIRPHQARIADDIRG